MAVSRNIACIKVGMFKVTVKEIISKKGGNRNTSGFNISARDSMGKSGSFRTMHPKISNIKISQLS
jgi:hypothetical protein